MLIKLNFNKTGCALGLILKVKVFGTWKWPIGMLCILGFHERQFKQQDESIFAKPFGLHHESVLFSSKHKPSWIMCTIYCRHLPT